MTKENTINVLVNMANSYHIDKKIVEIVKNNFDEIDSIREKAHQNAVYEYEQFNSKFEKNKNAYKI